MCLWILYTLDHNSFVFLCKYLTGSSVFCGSLLIFSHHSIYLTVFVIYWILIRKLSWGSWRELLHPRRGRKPFLSLSISTSHFLLWLFLCLSIIWCHAWWIPTPVTKSFSFSASKFDLFIISRNRVQTFYVCVAAWISVQDYSQNMNLLAVMFKVVLTCCQYLWSSQRPSPVERLWIEPLREPSTPHILRLSQR